MQLISKTIIEDKIDVDEYLKEYSVSNLPIGADPVSFYTLYKKYYEKFPNIEDESEEATKAYNELMDEEDKMLRVMLKSFIKDLIKDKIITGEEE